MPLPLKITIKLDASHAKWAGKLKIYWIHDSTSCGFYRAWLPLTTLRQARLADCRSFADDMRQLREDPFLTPAFRGSQRFVQLREKLVYDNVEWADLVVLQRMAGDAGMRLLEFAKRKGKAVVHESDDLCEEVVRDNPAHWFWRQEKLLASHGEFFRRADLVTTTNERLADYYTRHYGSKVIVLPNQIDYGSRRWATPDYRKGPNVVVGWMGSESHTADLEILRGIIPRLTAEFPSLEFKFSGYFPDWARAMERTSHVKGKGVDATPLTMADWDIGLAPINDVPFNTSGKSDIKWIEYGMASIFTVASKLEPYYSSIEHGGSGLLAKWDDADDWMRQLRKAITRTGFRAQVVKNVQAQIRKERTIYGNVGRWFRAYADLLNGRRL